MFTPGDFVQPRMGGGEKLILKAEDVTPYCEEGDFGVC